MTGLEILLCRQFTFLSGIQTRVERARWCRAIVSPAGLDIAMDWSDHALWWPARNVWLTRTRFTLDQYGVQADALLHFTPMHKTLRVQLPDLRYLDCRVDFSLKTFNAVVNLSKELGFDEDYSQTLINDKREFVFVRSTTDNNALQLSLLLL
uniref:Kindlin-2 N-terminal domain-containing protein n=1 Tax=Timema bartmani TaxID=61472 RepID=A0A7R9F595_9NEOP|nr:unnamed protein product [Timema bartmani]